VIDVLEKGVFPTASFVTHRVPFNEMIAGFESWTKPETGVVKAMVNMD
jgi:threonine dehydrogenase-like Zn-dependent dehydrogenase